MSRKRGERGVSQLNNLQENALQEQVLTGYRESFEYFTERIAALEFALEDRDWYRLSGETEREFSRDGLRTICNLSRLFYLKNPLIQRGVNVQRDYVFGQGVTIKAEAEEVNEIIQAFLDDAKNQAELTSHQAMTGKEVELNTAGNIFFVFFVDPANGRVRVRSIDVDEIEEIISNPDDAKDPWYYKRVWSENHYNLESGNPENVTHTAYYPDWQNTEQNKRSSIGGNQIYWDTPIYHVKVGGLPNMKFGVPETYAALDWAKAYKEFLEDWATIVRAYSRFAWNVSVKGGKSGIAAAKTKLGTTLGTSSGESNPPPVTGSTFIGGEGTNLSPVRTAGATTSAEDGRRLLLMVAATLGLPESFFGDVSVGTLATAKSLDRPTELKFVSRQLLWKGILNSILDYVIYQAILAGTLAGTIEKDIDGTPIVLTGGEKPEIRIAFPPVLEHDVIQSVDAVIKAATLNGSSSAGTIDDESLVKMLLTALGEEDMVDTVLGALEKQEEEDTPPTEQIPEQIPEQEAFLLAIKELRQTLSDLKEGAS